LHWIDVVIIVLVVTASVFGMARGLFLQGALIGGAVGGLFVARADYGGATDFLAHFYDRSTALTVVSYALIFILFFLLVGLVAITIRGGMRFFPKLGMFDQLGGAALGGIMGVVLIEALVVLAGESHDPALVASLRQSYLAALFRDLLPGITSLIPHDFLPTAR